MTLATLTEEERRIVFACLHAAAHGPFFDDEEFHTLFGLERHDVAAIAAAAPNIDDADDDVRLAINNALANLIHYPHGERDAWRDLIPAEPFEVDQIFYRWRRGHPRWPPYFRPTS